MRLLITGAVTALDGLTYAGRRANGVRGTQLTYHRPMVDFALGITETVDWYRNNHKVWTPLRQGRPTS
ncbi:hypothetical protein GCM10022403_080730 [Streptomyces coacervatus]|uniref:Uncharacterized protein n=1 Tax=Streptomyces coacervatus TaxID=647381 RepID=A0ABP7J640_9ACTN|nr:hypothetical protein [Streptomyces coacervatus]MDF2269451.1 hypothetical protein [Streptomyces coacervatus]